MSGFSGFVGLREQRIAPAEILVRWQEEQFVAGIPEPIMLEIARALAKPYFQSRLSLSERRAALAELEKRTRFVSSLSSIVGIATHKEDDLVIATAVSLNAECIVTRDVQLLRLRTFEAILILSPLEFLEHLDKELANP